MILIFVVNLFIVSTKRGKRYKGYKLFERIRSDGAKIKSTSNSQLDIFQVIS